MELILNNSTEMKCSGQLRLMFGATELLLSYWSARASARIVTR
jgi:hypothetical protein